MHLINLTPHPITIESDEVYITIPPSGKVARVLTEEMTVPVKQSARADQLAILLAKPGALCLADDDQKVAIAVPVVVRTFTKIEGLPKTDRPCIVSSLVLEAAKVQQPWRRRIYAPDTGPTAIRDDTGKIVAVRRLITF
jgi:hypothetical protein